MTREMLKRFETNADPRVQVLSTDDGHNSGPASSNWANNNPETIIDVSG